jgi:glycosyltransferase involved in cell wall biosynthesis
MTARLDGLRICMLVTNDVSRDARVQKEAETAASVGAEVIVIGVGRSDCRWEPFGYEVRLVEPFRASSAHSRLVRILQNMLRMHRFDRRIAEIARAYEPHIVHANDLDTLRAGVRAARGGAKVVYDAHEIYTEFVNNRWKWILGRRERRLLRRADGVIAVNRAVAEWLREHRHLSELPAVVMNGPTYCSAGSTVNDGPLRMLFQGQFFRDRNIEAAVRCMPGLRGRAVLTLQGWGETEKDLRRLVTDLEVEDIVTFLPPCTPSETVDYASQNDVGLITYRPLHLNLYLSSPNKLFDYLGAGLAVVAPPLPVLREILEGSGSGVVFEHEGAPSLCQVLDQLASDRERVEALKANAVEACHRYSWASQANCLLGVYLRVLGKDET